MPSRRDVLRQASALALGVTGYLPFVPSTRVAVSSGWARISEGCVRSAQRRDESTLRLGGTGDGYDMTWGAEDQQYVIVNDGTGWDQKPREVFNTRLWAVSGVVQGAVFSGVSGYPALSDSGRPDNAARYFGNGLLAVNGHVFEFLSTLDGVTHRPQHWVGSKLIYSNDGGRTWCNRDGTSPVVGEDSGMQSHESLAFFHEPDECFSLLSIVQMGCDYAANRDGYIYTYGLNGNVDGRMNELVMFRAPIGRLHDRRSYEYFGGRSGNGSPRWVRDIEARVIVHTFPRGWVNRTNLFPGDLVMKSWLPSVVYNEPLGLYLMASAGIGCAADGSEFGKPSYLGFWASATPWGPWRQFHEETAWTPDGEPAARAYCPRIAPRWIAADGKSFWLVWSDLQGIMGFTHAEPQFIARLEKAASPQERATVEDSFTRRYLQRYAFNAQRVDLR